MALDSNLIKAGLQALIGKEHFEPKEYAISIPVTSEQLFKYTYPVVNVEDIPRNGEKEIKIFIKTLTGKTFALPVQLDLSVSQIKALICEKEGIPPDQQRLIFGGCQLEDHYKLSECEFKSNITEEIDKIQNGSVIHLVIRLRGGGAVMYRIDDEFLEPRFDYDFQRITDAKATFHRGGKRYIRPIGSMRYAIKVCGKYPDEKWLGATGNDEDEWPVAYHGTNESNLPDIIKNGSNGT